MSASAALVPVVPLNFAAVSKQTPFSRDIVEDCVRQTLATLYQALASETNVFLSFKGIGVLSFRNNKVTNLSVSLVLNHITVTSSTVFFSVCRKGSDEVQEGFH